MKIKALLAMLFSVMLVFGLATFATAQTNPDQKPKSADKQKDADRDDDDEDDSPEMQAKLAKQAKITIEQARKIALERVAGTITEEEIEMENGILVYSIEIRDANGKTQDVEVDAKTGEIVRVEPEDDDDDEGDDDDDAAKKKEKSTQKSRKGKKPF
ncbi:MAG TPA: PepSY domain-containing protein [Pyrinomonadaceae bacterium]|nr:PepSY domain-containing protein [Pyrinomonadaceae bacterium]